MATTFNNTSSRSKLSPIEVKNLVDTLRNPIASNEAKMLARDKLQEHWYTKFLSDSYLKNQFKRINSYNPKSNDSLWENYRLYCSDAFFKTWEEILRKVENPKYENSNPDGLFSIIFHSKRVDIYRKNKIEMQHEDYSDYEGYLLGFTHAFDDENHLAVVAGLERAEFFNKIDLKKEAVEQSKLDCIQKNNCKRHCAGEVCKKFDGIIEVLQKNNLDNLDTKLKLLALDEQKWNCLNYCEQNCSNADSCLKYNLMIAVKNNDSGKKLSYEDAEKIYPWNEGACKTHVDRYAKSVRTIYEKLKSKYLK